MNSLNMDGNGECLIGYLRPGLVHGKDSQGAAGIEADTISKGKRVPALNGIRTSIFPSHLTLEQF
jgi:hypothetical protein